MYNSDSTERFELVIDKLLKKDPFMYKRVLKKIDEILNCFDVENYKNLRGDLKNHKRVHVGSFVLIFRYFQEESKIKFIEFLEKGEGIQPTITSPAATQLL